MNPIDALFERLRNQKRKAFIPFITAGDPDLNTTQVVIQELAGRGADLVEIGFPYSDPIADGPVIQASYTRALDRGVHLDDILEMVRRAAVSTTAPLVGMVSCSLVHHRDAAQFVADAQQAGLSGLIIPDLPIEESEDIARLAAERDFKLIQLITPTTPRERAVRIAKLSTGFLYYVSVTGITGERDRLPAELLDQLRWLRGQTDLPICVGFGISKPEHVAMLRDVADGVIVGSALVRYLEQADSRPVPEIVRAIGEHAQTLIDALNPK
jgi:tryptophan synthase alpha chain